MKSRHLLGPCRIIVFGWRTPLFYTIPFERDAVWDNGLSAGTPFSKGFNLNNAFNKGSSEEGPHEHVKSFFHSISGINHGGQNGIRVVIGSLFKHLEKIRDDGIDPRAPELVSVGDNLGTIKINEGQGRRFNGFVPETISGVEITVKEILVEANL